MDTFFSSIFGHHSPFLVLLSYIIAIISAYASIDLARKVMFSSGASKAVWLISGGATLGIGIWSMHFIAMLAHHFPEPVYYSTSLVIISVFVAAFACISGYYLISRNLDNRILFWFAGILMGLGIVAMHYIGTEAVRPLLISYDIPLLILSVIIAIAASLVALWVGFLSPNAKAELSWKIKLLSSIRMAVAITGMHYTGMAATHFAENPDGAIAGTSSIDTALLAWIVAIVTFVLFFMFFFSIVFNRVWRKLETVQNAILDSAADGIVITDKESLIIHANPAFYELMKQLGIHQKFSKLHEYNKQLSENKTSSQNYIVDVNARFLEVNRHAVLGESLNNSLWFIQDISESVQSKQRIEFLAYHDMLTNLPNRHKLDSVLQEWLQSEEKIGCIFFNVDRLKFINDTLGLQAGDSTLQHIAELLQDCIEKEDFLARVGGDEFIILVAGERVKELRTIAQRCLQHAHTPFFIRHKESVEITLSAGGCTYPEEAESADELLQFADLALTESKKNGKNQATFFNVAIKEQHKRRLQLEDALSTALDRNEFHLVYQPKVALKSETIIGTEALLRWTHPVLGHISPMEFIPIAEEKGMIHAIGEWVLREACSQWTKWTEELDEPVIIAVNISPLQLTNEKFIPALMRAIAETGIDPNFLELEVTESASLAFETEEILNKIRHTGIQISLDDFGTGYSSFSQLKELPIHVLKIDKSFIDNLLGNKGQEAIVRSIIQLGHNLNLLVLVEGVEQKEEAEWLKQEGCDIVQGYYYYKPLPPQAITELLRQQLVQQT